MTRLPTSGGTGDDDLLDQWSFLDSMIERQASSLRAGAQDPEETDELPVTAVSVAPELEELRGRIATVERERDKLRKDLDKARREVKAGNAQRELAASAATELEDTRNDLAAVRAQLAQAHATIDAASTELAEARAAMEASEAATLATLDQERQGRQRAEAHSADLMRALRVAHADLEAARTQASVIDASPPPAQPVAPQAPAAPTPPVAAPVASVAPIAPPALPVQPAPVAYRGQAPEHPGFDVFEAPKDPPMATRYQDGPPATSSADLRRPPEAPRPPSAPERTSLKDRWFGRRR